MKKRLVALLLVVVLSVSLLATTVAASAVFTPSSAAELIARANHNKGTCNDKYCHYCHPCKDCTCGYCYPNWCDKDWDYTWCAKCGKYDCKHVKTLYFNTNGGSPIAPVSAISGAKIDLDWYTPVRLGYEFDGWYSNKNLTRPIDTVKLTKDTTVYAKWEKTCYSALIPFLDIPVNSYYYQPACWATNCGVVTGSQYFKPDAACTRADLMTFLWRAVGAPQSKLTYMPFTDVSENAYYCEAVKWALETGLTKGTNNLKFRPDDTITREQMVTILYRYAQYKGYDVSVGENTNILSYNDAFDVSEYAIPAMQWACGEGLITGANGYLTPQELATRAHAITILHRFFDEIA